MDDLFKISLLLFLFSLLFACGNSQQVSNVTSWTGTRMLGAASASTVGHAVATDSSGNVYVGGVTTGDLDGNTLTGGHDFFVTRYNSNGEKQYTRQLGVSSLTTVGNAVATDASRNVYVAGYTSGGLDGNTLRGTIDAFVTKYTSSGVKQFTRQFGATAAYTFGNAVATDANGSVYVAGYTSGSLDGNTLTGTIDAFVTKYSNTGVKQYTRQFGIASANTSGNAVATDAAGNVYVVGSTMGNLDGNTLTGTQDFFIAKYDSGGVKQYTRQLGALSVATFGNAVSTDANGGIYVVGSSMGNLDGNTLTGTSDFFVTKFNSDGTKQFTRQLGAALAETTAYAVATDTCGYFYVAGLTAGNLDGNTLNGSYDAFFTKYTSNGSKQYTRLLGGLSSDTRGHGVATDARCNVFLAGSFIGVLDGNALVGYQDTFVSKYDLNGEKQ